MNLIEDRIKHIFPLKEKKVKVKVNAVREMFEYFCKQKSKKGYIVKRDTLLKPVEEVKKNIELRLKGERELYVKLKKEQLDNFYSVKLLKDIESCQNRIRELELEKEDLKYNYETIRKVISYEDFKKILLINNEYICDEIIKGKTYNISYRVGYIEIRIIARGYKTLKVNFGATNKKKKELLDSGIKEEDLYDKEINPTGIKYVQYYIDDDYGRIMWDKGALKNISVYKFYPTVCNVSKKGFKNKFSQAIINNPELKKKYPKINYSTHDI